MANGASVNELRDPHCSETDAGFQPVCTDARLMARRLIPVARVEGILTMKAETISGEKA